MANLILKKGFKLLSITIALSLVFSDMAIANGYALTNKMDNTHLSKNGDDLLKLCEANDAEACNELALMLESKSRSYLIKSCELDYMMACVNLGYVYEAEDIVESIKLYMKACDLKNSIGCFNLGHLYAKGKGVKQDIDKAKEYYHKACKLGDKLSCVLLSK